MHKSVTWFIVYLDNLPISWKPKGQKSVTISSTKAEYIALSDLITELKYLYQVLEIMEEDIQLQIIVHVDNASAIFLAQNWVAGQHTKHIDIQYHFVWEYYEDGMVKIIFVAGTQNDSDIFTKNLPTEPYKKHGGKLIKDTNEEGVE